MPLRRMHVLWFLAFATSLGCGGGRSGIILRGDGGAGWDGKQDGVEEGGLREGALREAGGGDGPSDGSSDGRRDGIDGSLADRPTDAFSDVPVDAGQGILSQIIVLPQISLIHVGTTSEFRAMGYFSDGASQDLTSRVTWTSSNLAAATVSTAGVAMGVAPGKATLTAQYQGLSGRATLTVVKGSLVQLEVSPANPTWPAKVKQAMTATGIFDDKTRQDVTAQVTWSSSDSQVADVAKSGAGAGWVTTLKAGQTTIQATLQGITGQSLVTVEDAALVRIEVTPLGPTLAHPSTRKFTATGVTQSGVALDLTSSVVWESSDTLVLGISNAIGLEGVATTVGILGNARVTASLGGLTGSTLVRVRNDPVALIVSPSSARAPKGNQATFTAEASFADGSMADVTATALWSTEDASIAVLSSLGAGTFQSVGSGTTRIIAQVGTLTGQATLTVSDATVTALTLTPKDSSLALGLGLQYQAVATFSDGSTGNVTNLATWSISDLAVARIENTVGRAGYLTALKVGTTDVSASFGGQTAVTKARVSDKVLDRIDVLPATATVVAGLGQAFTAMGTFSDGSTADLTQEATWVSDDPGIATVSNAAGERGRTTGLSAGQTTVRAQRNGKDGTAILTVTSARAVQLSLSPLLPSRRVGQSLQFLASALSSGGTRQDVTAQTSFISSQLGIATVVATSGRATCIAPGTATITGSYVSEGKTLTGSASLFCEAAAVIGLQIQPFLANLAVGQTQGFTATLIWSDGSTQDRTAQSTWSSSTPAVADVDASTQRGRVAGIAPGTASVTATTILNGTSYTATAGVTVRTSKLVSVAITPPMAVLALGETVSFVATGLYDDGTSRGLTDSCTWTSSDRSVVDVTSSAARGRATGLKPGTATLTATYAGPEGTFSDTATAAVSSATLLGLSVSPSSASLVVEQNTTLVATALYNDGSSRIVTLGVLWSTSDARVADVSNDAINPGRATGLGAGTATITATYQGISDSTLVTVRAPKPVTLSLSQVSITLHRGQTVQLDATILYDDGTRVGVTGAAAWTSSAPAVADVANASAQDGRVTALAAGTAVITATYLGLKNTATLTVTSAQPKSLSVTPVVARLPVGQIQRFVATVVYDDGSLLAVTTNAIWTSSDPSVAHIGNSGDFAGRATALKAGTTNIKATWMGLANTVPLVVTSATVSSLSVSPIGATLHLGQTQGFVAVALYSDGTLATVTGQALWQSSNAAVAAISNSSGSQGVATGLSAGTVTLTASFAGISDSQTLTVVDSKPLRVEVTPVAVILAVGQTQDYVAIAIYDDQTTRNVTGSATWNSSSGTVADVSNASDSRGRVTALGAGTATLTATWNGLAGSTSLTVSSATLTSIQVSPINLYLPVGVLGRQYEAVALYSDGTRQTITGQASWTSSVPTVAEVSNQAGAARGDVTTLSPGTTEISAALHGVTGKTNLTVTAATVLELQIAPTLPWVLPGSTQQFTALAVLSDYSVLNVTGLAIWSSSAATVAAISNGASRGLATALSPGTTTLTANYGGQSATTTLTVGSATGLNLHITPAQPTSPAGISLRFVATAITADGQSKDVTNEATWTTSDETVASIRNDAGARGLAFARAAGTATIKATMGTASAQTTFTVGSQTLSAIVVTAPAVNLAVGATQPYLAMGTYSDGSSYDITAFATWLSTQTSVATVSNGTTRGLATGVAAGSTTVEAHFQGKTGTATLTVP